MKGIQEGAIFSQLLSAPAVAIFQGTNNEMANTITIYIDLYQEEEEDKWEGKNRILLWVKRELPRGILEYGCCLTQWFE